MRNHSPRPPGHRQAMANIVARILEKRIGKLFKVKGGRDFDGSINAKKVWF